MSVSGSPAAEADRGALADQRDFLLRSLEDLEREHDAGDVDDHDYAALKDDYTARAARVLRALEAERPPVVAAPPRSSWRRRSAVALVVGAFAVLAGVLVAHTAGRRDDGQTITGGTRQSVTEKLNSALREANEGHVDSALHLYDQVLDVQPDNVEAQTYRAWVLTLSGNLSDGLTALLEVATAHPTYPDVHAFLAVVFFRTGLVDQSARELDRLDRLNPPAEIRQLTSSLRTQIQQAQASTTTTTAQPGGGR
jgi:tetratricopeptide (TPR) repeat protein